MSDDLGKDPNDRGTRRKGVKGPRKDPIKRRSAKDQSGTSARGTSESVQTDQTSGKDSSLASTTTGRPMVQTPPPGEAKRSAVTSETEPQPKKEKSADAASREDSTPANPNDEHIARRAYALYEAGGYRGEDALQHWLEAERELRNRKDDKTREN